MARFPHLTVWLVGLAMFVAGCQSAGTQTAAVTTDHPRETADPVAARLAEARWQAELGNNHIARESYTTILKSNAQSAEALIGLARLDQTAGRIVEAEQGFKAALALEPDNVDVISAVAQFYTSTERWDDAEQILSQSLERRPEDATLTFQLAVLCAKLGRTQEALDYFGEAVGAAEAHYNLALVLYNDGQKQAAEKHLMQALLLKPDFADAKLWLGEVTGERTTQSNATRTAGGKAPPAPSTTTKPVIQQTSRQEASPVVETRHPPAVQLAAAPQSLEIEPPRTASMTAAQREQRENQLRAAARR